MRYQLKGKVVLITGAAGGIGAATARHVYGLGADLVLTDRQSADVQALASEFDADRVLPIALDVTDARATRAVVDQAVQKFGRLDVALANAGIAWKEGLSTVASCDEDEFEHILEVNLLGVWRTIRAALPEVMRNQGQILITSSIYAFLNGMANAPYAASKAAVESLGRTLRTELAGTGATASVVYPGWTATAIAEIAFGGDELATRLNQTALPALLRRPVSPEQVARGIAQGIQTRRPRIVVPARWQPVFGLRGLFNPLVDRYLDGHSGIHELLRQVEAEAGRNVRRLIPRAAKNDSADHSERTK